MACVTGLYKCRHKETSQLSAGFCSWICSLSIDVSANVGFSSPNKNSVELCSESVSLLGMGYDTVGLVSNVLARFLTSYCFLCSTSCIWGLLMKFPDYHWMTALPTTIAAQTVLRQETPSVAGLVENVNQS